MLLVIDTMEKFATVNTDKQTLVQGLGDSCNSRRNLIQINSKEKPEEFVANNWLFVLDVPAIKAPQSAT